MTKTIIVHSKNGAENIRLSRLATRESNLSEDKELWKELAATPCSKLLPVKDKSLRDAMNVGSTITERIVSKLADHFNITSKEEVTREMIASMAQIYLDANPLLQLWFCRDPSRQSIDEEVQKKTLEKYLTNATVTKPSNGKLTLMEGDIVKKPDDNKVEARSIDFLVEKGPLEFNIFAKYSAVSGSGQTHQAEESRRFVKEAMKYIDKHNDGKYFIVLTDGAEGESHLPEMNELASGYTNIFAGNCESVINFIESK